MENLIAVATQVGVLFVLMGAGAACRLARLIDEAAVRGMVNVLLLVVTPCLVVDAFQRPFDPAMARGFAWAFAVAVLAHAAAAVLSRLVPCRDADSRPVLRLAMVFSNAGFMGIPLEQAVLGPEGVFYGIVYVVVFNLFIWSWGLGTMRGRSGTAPDSGRAASIRPMVVNPGTVGIAVALPLFLFSVRLPEALRAPVASLASMNTPLAMLVVGFHLAGADFRRVLRMPSAWAAAAVRLAVFPLAVVALLVPARSHLPRAMMLATVIAASAPVAAMVSMFASKFRRDVDLSVGLVSATTLLSIATMPPVIALAMAVL